MNFENKIAVVVREDLETWQKLNVTAFLMSGIAGTQSIIGEPYMDKDGKEFLPMSQQPILVFGVNKEEIKEVFNKALNREIKMSIYTEELFQTYNDEDNRAMVGNYKTEELNLVGIGLFGKKNHIDRTLKGFKLHP
jgi:hypothetical protein